MITQYAPRPPWDSQPDQKSLLPMGTSLETVFFLVFLAGHVLDVEKYYARTVD